MSALAKPVLLMLTMLVADELHTTLEVMSFVLPSLKVPVAMNCWLLPTMTVAAGGVTAMDTRVGVTVRLAAPPSESNVAVILDWPAATPVANPRPLIVAMLFAEEFQITLDVMFFLRPSLYVPIAVNCWVAPVTIEVTRGPSAIDLRTGAEPCASPPLWQYPMSGRTQMPARVR